VKVVAARATHKYDAVVVGLLREGFGGTGLADLEGGRERGREGRVVGWVRREGGREGGRKKRTLQV
jgi:hypothetical protein